MILAPQCVEIDTRKYPPRCAILGEDGEPIIWIYGKTGGHAIHQMQEFVAMMIREKSA